MTPPPKDLQCLESISDSWLSQIGEGSDSEGKDSVGRVRKCIQSCAHQDLRSIFEQIFIVEFMCFRHISRHMESISAPNRSRHSGTFSLVKDNEQCMCDMKSHSRWESDGFYGNKSRVQVTKSLGACTEFKL